jgi:N-acetylneuraminic acid mutarotase
MGGFIHRTTVGVVLVAMMALAGAGAAQAAWSGLDPLAGGRYNHTATLLADGRVLVAGGSDTAPLASARVYDPKTSTWSNAASMNNARQGEAAVLLHSGKVLVAGGYAPGALPASPSGYTRTAEIYDPATDAWTQVASMGAGRFQPTMTVLDDGRVLVAGGYGDVDGPNGVRQAVSLDSAELYDPAHDTWTAAAPMASPRSLDTATLLPGGDVLVAGGLDSATGELASAERYHPQDDTWAPAGSLATARDAATATALPSGDVLVAGGSGGSDSALASAEIYRAGSGTWEPAHDMAGARQSAAAALLKDGTVLVAGGKGSRGGDPLASTERYDPALDTWTDAGALALGRPNLTLTALTDGRALVVGGAAGTAVGFSGSPDVERFSLATTSLTALDFGSLLVGTPSDVKTAVLTNTGNVPVDVTGVSIAGPSAFQIVSDTCHAATIAAGDTCTVDVRFTPSAAGGRTATLTVADGSTAAGSTTATLSGAGTDPASTAAGAPQGGGQGAPAPTAGSAGGPAAGQTGTAPGAGRPTAGGKGAAHATCTVKTARSHGRTRSTVTCAVAWPTSDAVALRARLIQGKRVLASGRATTRGGRAVLQLRAAGRLRKGRYTVAIARADGTPVLRQAVRAA